MPRNLWPWLIVLALTLVIAPWLALQAHFAGDPVERQARALERSLRCPVCEGQSVADSNSAVALEMREQIRSLLAQGKTPEEVLRYFADRYGQWVIFMPPRRGVFLLGWLLPFVALAGGGWLLHHWLRTRNDLVAARSGPPRVPGSAGDTTAAPTAAAGERSAAPDGLAAVENDHGNRRAGGAGTPRPAGEPAGPDDPANLPRGGQPGRPLDLQEWM